VVGVANSNAARSAALSAQRGRPAGRSSIWCVGGAGAGAGRNKY